MSYKSTDGWHRTDLDDRGYAHIRAALLADKWLVGDFCFEADPEAPQRATFWYYPPGLDPGPFRIPVSTTAADEPKYWLWDGNREKPTITPSIRLHAGGRTGIHWHGNMIAGRFVAQ